MGSWSPKRLGMLPVSFKWWVEGSRIKTQVYQTPKWHSIDCLTPGRNSSRDCIFITVNVSFQKSQIGLDPFYWDSVSFWGNKIVLLNATALTPRETYIPNYLVCRWMTATLIGKKLICDFYDFLRLAGQIKCNILCTILYDDWAMDSYTLSDRANIEQWKWTIYQKL